MGASKELSLQNSEAMQEWERENTNDLRPVEQQENTEYIDLLKRLQNKTERLSYSSLKAFAKSPRNFIQYKLKPRSAQTESQIFGSLCDCLLTEPEKIDEMFYIVSKIPTSENQVAFCKDMFDGKTKEEAYANNYKTGGVDKVYEAVGDYVEAVLSGKMVCTKEMKEEAEKIVENLKKSELVMQYIDACTGFQVKTEWTYSGWNFVGYKDGCGTNIIIDFKYSKDSDPEKFEREIINYDYFMQAGMYVNADDGFPEYYLIVYDKSLNFSVLKLDISLISYGIRKYQYLVKKMEQCIKENRWSESYNFFDVQQRTVYKPKWIKGFETDPDDVE